MIATACDAYTDSQERPSFLARAREHLNGAGISLAWVGGETVQRSLDRPISVAPDAYPRVRYLSQQFVEELCSVEGMPALIAEIERVIFESHSSMEKEGTIDFAELRQLRAGEHYHTRIREQASLQSISDQIGVELEKNRLISGLRSRIAEREKQLARYQADWKALLPKGPSSDSAHLEALITSADKVRGYLRFFSTQQASLAGLTGEVADLRKNRAPEALRAVKERFSAAGFEPSEWETFTLQHRGDVDALVAGKLTTIADQMSRWKGTVPAQLAEGERYIDEGDDLSNKPLGLLEAEITRVQKIVSTNQDVMKRLAALSRRMAEETALLEKQRADLIDYEGAKGRAQSLVEDREAGYVRVFKALEAEEQVLRDLYSPLLTKLESSHGSLSKLSFTVRRVVDIKSWADNGEQNLFDLRSGPFKGIGSLAAIATEELKEAWENGDAEAIALAMATFREKYQPALLEKARIPNTDETNYRPWTRSFAKWLYSTDHISIDYGIKYDGIEIKKLSPGTRGIVLILLYLALDEADDRPLVIDQPEENLDPKSINDELVPIFQRTKRTRQVIMVTHNANLVVNTDADQIIVAEVGPNRTGALPSISYKSGGLDEKATREQVCEILEGGEVAFRDRARRLRIKFDY